MTRRRGTAQPNLRVVTAVGPALIVGVLGAVTMLSFEPRGLAVLLLLVQCLPLAARERFPLPVLGVTAVGAVAQVLLGFPPSNAFLGQAVALATVVRRTAWPWSLLPALLVLAANLGAAWWMNLPGVGRLAVIQAATFGLAWAFGDAAARRLVVERSIEDEISSRAATADLRTRLGAMSERLRIARELHSLAGSGLDTIAAHVAAARRQLPHGAAREPVQAIEVEARRVLAELDRFLGLLRRAPSTSRPRQADESSASPALPDVIAAEATSETHRSPTRATAGPWQRIAPAVSLVAPPLVVAVLTVVDGFTGEAASWPGTASILAYAAAASLPLLARRRYPAVVMMLLTLASAVPLVLGFPVADGPLGIVVAAHALASYRSRAVAVGLAACGVGTISVLAALLAVAYAAQLGSLLVVFSAVAIYVGETDQLARTHLATLADRLRDAQEQDRLRERAAVAEQRAAAARDLHDSIGHALSLIVVQAGAVRLALSTAAVTGNRAAETLSAIEASVQKALADLERGLDLTPDQPLGAATEASPAALQDLTDAVRATGTPVQLKADDLGEVPASLHTAVYRLVQEALTNVVKHAPGAATEVVVGRHGDTVQVRIANTTPGSAASAHLPSGSRGLAGMRERAALFGGRFAARPRSDGGFVVEATLPVPSPAPDAPARRP